MKHKIYHRKKDNIKSKNTAFRVAMLLLIIIAIGVMIGTISYTLNKSHQQRESIKRLISYSAFNTTVEVTSGSIGLNVDTDGLKYGKTVPGGGGTRFLDINASEDSFIEIYLSGEMSAFLSIKENKFFMGAGESRRVPVYLDVPNSTAIGHYYGKIYVLMFRPIE